MVISYTIMKINRISAGDDGLIMAEAGVFWNLGLNSYRFKQIPRNILVQKLGPTSGVVQHACPKAPCSFIVDT